MFRRTCRTLAAGLALLVFLSAPGSEAFQALAAVTAQQHDAAPVPVSAQVGSLGSLKAGSLGTLAGAPVSISLQGSINLSPAPEVGAQKAASVVPVTQVQASASSASALEEAARTAPIVTFMAAPQASLPGTPATPVRSTLSDLSQGAERISAGARQDGSGQAQRQAIDELFLGKGLFAPADVAASPIASQPSALEPAARQGAPSLKAPAVLLSPEGTKPERSLKRTFRVGWLAAVGPVAFTFLVTTVAQLLGYHLHPGYQGVAPSVLSLQTVAATFGMAAVMAPVSEEMFFRSGLMGGIRKLTKHIPLLGDFWLPALVSSVVFVALHELSDPVLFFTRLAHSMVLSWAWKKEGLASSVAAHAIFNGLLTLPMILGLLPGPLGVAAGLLALPLAALATWKSIKGLRDQKADSAAGRVAPYEISSKQSLLLAGLLIAGYYLLAHNPIWFLGAMGYAWRAVRTRKG